MYKYVFTYKLTYVNSVPSRLGDVIREDLDVIAVGPSDCRQVDAEAAVKLLAVCVHDSWWRHGAASCWDCWNLKDKKHQVKTIQTIRVNYGQNNNSNVTVPLYPTVRIWNIP